MKYFIASPYQKQYSEPMPSRIIKRNVAHDELNPHMSHLPSQILGFSGTRPGLPNWSCVSCNLWQQMHRRTNAQRRTGNHSSIRNICMRAGRMCRLTPNFTSVLEGFCSTRFQNQQFQQEPPGHLRKQNQQQRAGKSKGLHVPTNLQASITRNKQRSKREEQQGHTARSLVQLPQHVGKHMGNAAMTHPSREVDHFVE